MVGCQQLPFEILWSSGHLQGLEKLECTKRSIRVHERAYMIKTCTGPPRLDGQRFYDLLWYSTPVPYLAFSFIIGLSL